MGFAINGKTVHKAFDTQSKGKLIIGPALTYTQYSEYIGPATIDYDDYGREMG